MISKYIPFDDAGRKVVFFAQVEAARSGTNEVAPEHYLLALLREPSYPSSRILTTLGVDLVRLRQDMEACLSPEPEVKKQNMKLTASTKHVLDLSYAEAIALRSNWFGTEHLLLGLVRGARGLVGKALTEHGVSEEACRAGIIAFRHEQ